MMPISMSANSFSSLRHSSRSSQPVRNATFPIHCSSKLAGNCAYGIGIIAKIHRLDNPALLPVTTRMVLCHWQYERHKFPVPVALGPPTSESQN